MVGRGAAQGYQVTATEGDQREGGLTFHNKGHKKSQVGTNSSVESLWFRHYHLSNLSDIKQRKAAEPLNWFMF